MHSELIERLVAEAEFAEATAADNTNISFVDPVKAWSATASAFREAIAALSVQAEPVAWMGHGPGAGSISGETRTTHLRALMEAWKSDGVEITPLYASPPAPAPYAGVSARKPLPSAPEEGR